MVDMTWEPKVDDIIVPKDKSSGRWARVVESDADRVRILVFSPGVEPHSQTLRLSTALGRFDLLRRPEPAST